MKEKTDQKKHFGYHTHRNIALHRFKAIYFYIPKVACSSIKTVVSDLLQIEPPNPKRPLAFIHERDYPFVERDEVLTKYKEYFKFCFVRNPWDRVVSCYFNKISTDEGLTNRSFKNGVAVTLLKHGDLFWGGMTFPDFARAVCRVPDDRADVHFRSQCKFVTCQEGTLLVDFIGRFENLEADFSIVCDKMGIENIRLPHLFKSERLHYRHYYDKSLQEEVEERYREDIKMFGYEF